MQLTYSGVLVGNTIAPGLVRSGTFHDIGWSSGTVMVKVCGGGGRGSGSQRYRHHHGHSLSQAGGVGTRVASRGLLLLLHV